MGLEVLKTSDSGAAFHNKNRVSSLPWERATQVEKETKTKQEFQDQDSFCGCNRPVGGHISSVASETSLVNASVDPPDITLGEPLAKFYFGKVF